MSEKSNAINRESSLRRKKANSVYHYRRRSKALFTEQYSGELKHVLGFTLKSNCAFASDPNSGLLAYPAGCVIVLHNPRQEKQLHIFNPGQKNLTCLKFSNDGNFIVTGEAGHQPCVRIFSVAERCQTVSFLSHKFGISCVAFSPNGKYVISIGYQHDNVINVWDWKKDKLAASNKVSTKIKNVAFSEDSTYFVTVGNRHVKFWYLENSTTDKTTVPLKGRSAILESLRNHVFCDVLCGIGSNSKFTFAISRSGILCQFNGQRTVEKYVELSCGTARSMCVIDEMLLCGCASGSVHVFHSNTLEFITEIFPPKLVRDYEIVAITIDVRNMWMHCVFSNHSLLVFDIMQFSSPQTHSLFQFHSSCVWDVKVIPPTIDSTSILKNCFLTCSGDGTTRAWDIEDHKCKLIKVFKLDQPMDGANEDVSPKHEARSLCVRCDAKHLAIGDRTGNIHVYDLETCEKLAFIPVHEGDILCMDYSKTCGMLASASRDRCVHTFDCNYNPTHTIADHSAAVTSVKFAHHYTDFRLVTCGSDKSLYFCAVTNNSGKTEITREQHFVEKHSMTDMAMLDDSVLVACGSNLSEYDVMAGKLKRSFKANESTTTIVRVAVNSQKTILATSCADKQIYVQSFVTTECLCVLNGHSEIATALAFGCENHLLSASADSCVFVWALKHRTIDDVRSLHTTSTQQPTSAASTPGSPELDRTAYFSEPPRHSLLTEPGDYEHSPRPLNGETPSVLSSPSDEGPELPPSGTSAPTDPFSNNLPTWVTKSLHNDAEPGMKHLPKPALGKWGNVMELEKVCEEIGNLSQRSDEGSPKCSLEGELPTSEENQSRQAAGSVDAKLPDATAVYDSNDDSKPTLNGSIPIDDGNDYSGAVETSESVAIATQEPTKHNDVIESDIASDDLTADISLEGGESPTLITMQDKGDDTFLSAGDAILNDDDVIPSADVVIPVVGDVASKKYLESDESNNKFKGENLSSFSLQEPKHAEEVATNCRLPRIEMTEEGMDCEEEFNKTYAVTQIPCVSEREVVNSIPADFVEPLNSCATSTDEDIDIRGAIYLKSDLPQHNEHKQDCPQINDVTFVKENTDVSSARMPRDVRRISPSNHLTTPLASQISPFPSPNIKLNENELRTKEVEEDPQTEEALDEATRNLVGTVLASTEDVSYQSSEAGQSPICCDPNEEENSTCNDVLVDLRPSDEVKKEAEPRETNNVQPCPQSMQHHSEVCNNPEINNDDTNMTSEYANAVSNSPDFTRLSTTNKAPSSNKNISLTTPRPSIDDKETDRSPSMPPAFAELLASLAKKRNSRVHPSESLPPRSSSKSLPPRRNNRMADSNIGAPENNFSSTRDCLHESYNNNNDMEGESPCHLENGSQYNPHVNDNSWHENQMECVRAGEALLATFNRAEAVYHKQRARSDEDVANGNNHFGFNKLLRSFQTIHSRIGGLKITNSVHPEETPLCSPPVALENVSNDSPVYSLLREYSDRLVGLVNAQTDHRNVLTTQADTV